MRPALRLASAVLVAAGFALAAGCGAGESSFDHLFESDDPSARAVGESADGGAASGSSSSGGSQTGAEPAPNDPGSGIDAQRAIEEADIIQVRNNRLYALSRTGGLAIVDVSVRDQLRLLGRFRTDAQPFEMYVRDGLVYLMLNDYGHWVQEEQRWVQSSEILAVDVSDPAQPKKVNAYDVPGEISDSRFVGDVMYVVTFENGYCWRCNDKPATYVSSYATVAGQVTKRDQIGFVSPTKEYSWGKRSVSASPNRMYIAGPDWNWTTGSQPHSVIQVVDISNPTGALVKGSDIAVDGQINSRWQMDEYQGYLRVVSQPGGWAGVNPRVETFRIDSSSAFVPGGATDLILPKPEDLRSVRFDGVRGYAITAEREFYDPLFTIDLTDPLAPQQKGELEMPGWVYHMEPRGDRLVALGFDSGQLTVSLFDVTDLATPTMIKRVNFGAGWSNVAEDQDRIHKSFQVLDDQNLIFVPFASSGGRFENGTCEQGQSGIQIIDYSHDDIVLRGVAPSHGQPRRAFLHDSRLFSVGDRAVETFDIADHGAPVKKAELAMANPAHRIITAGQNIVQLTDDWMSGEAFLSITPKANADLADPIGRISLKDLADSAALRCGSMWTSWWSARMFANGNNVYVAVPIYGYYDIGNTSGNTKSLVLVGNVDISDPAHPHLVGKAKVELAQQYGYHSGFLDGYSYYSYGGWNVVGSGSGIVQKGTTLAFLSTARKNGENNPYGYGYGYGAVPEIERTVHVVDFANPAAPTVNAVDLGTSLGSTPLLLEGSTVLTSRWEAIPSRPGKVRFYVDRVDISNGASPFKIPSVNVPGSLLWANPDGGRWITTDYTRSETFASDWSACYNKGDWNARFDYPTNTCVVVRRTFKVLDVAGNGASLRQSIEPVGQNIGGIEATADRLYLTLYPQYDYTTSSNGYDYAAPKLRPGTRRGLFVYGDDGSGDVQLLGSMEDDAKWPLAVNGTRVALYADSGLVVYDMATPSAPRLVGSGQLRGYGYTSDVVLENDRAVCALGELGLQTVGLTP